METRDPITNEKVEEKRQKILEDYKSSVFSGKTTGSPPVRGPLGEAEVILKPGAKPVKQKAFAISGERRDAWIRLIDQLVKDGKIEAGYGPWNSPSFPVPKKLPGDYRLVVDYRALNAATETDAHPLPRIEEILQRQGIFKIWSVLDMKDGYHQVPLKKEHRNLTCMSTPLGTMRWKVLVMGLKNGNAIFQRVMEYVLRNEDMADAYVDDVIIGSTGDSEEEVLINHEKDLRRVLDTLARNTLVVDPRKAHMFMKEVEFCGHVIREGARRPADKKLKSIEKWEAPKTVSQLRGFLGLANYYSNYVKNYAQLAHPLMDMLKVDKQTGIKGSKIPIVWTEEEKLAFENVKQALTKSLELFQVEPDKPFRMQTDASNYAVGGVLEQERGGKWVPVSFYSRKLTGSQKNWSVTEKETYAIVACLWKWSGWIGHSQVDIITGHKALEKWVTSNSNTPSGPTGRKARWHEVLSQFNLTVQYQPGESNTVADAMSRWAYLANTDKEDVCIHGSTESAQQVKDMEKPVSEIMHTFKTEDYKLDPLVRNQALIKLGLENC